MIDLNVSFIIKAVLLLSLATALGSIVGYERERQNRPAGLRTHALVCLGSAIITLVGIYGFNGVSDPSRIAAQIVSGIGFLGAGTILREGFSVRGLTTAASLWTTAGIGIAVGVNMPVLAVIGTLLVTLVLTWLSRFERNGNLRSGFLVKIAVTDRQGILSEVASVLNSSGASIVSSETYLDRAAAVVHMEISATKPKDYKHFDVLQKFLNIDGIIKADINDI